MENSKIEWCHHTVNLWHGCFEVHKGCDNCYAKQQSNRYHGPHLLWQQNGPRMVIKSAFDDLWKYQNRAEKLGVNYFIFINSMSDIFEKDMPLVNFKHELIHETTRDIRASFFDLIPHLPNLTFLLLTKRPSNIKNMIPIEWLVTPPQNVIYGTSIVDQETHDTLAKQLLAIPGRHFFSMEPLLDDVDIIPSIATGKVDWVIVGGESGFYARPMHPFWAWSLRDQCDEYDVPFFFKQNGEYQFQPENENYPTHVFPNGITVHKVGKKLAGSLLDGIPHKAFPEFYK